MRGFALSAILLAAALAGCIDGSETQVPPPAGPLTELLAGPSVWTDPQNAPHAAFGWPTLTNPPVDAPDWWKPINGTALPESIAGIAPLAQATDVKSGAGMAMFGSIAFVPGFGPESYVVDISQPSAPRLLATFAPESSHRGAAMIAYPDGRLVTVVSTNTGFDIIELTEPSEPVLLNATTPAQGGHKLGVVPGTPIVYNAASAGGGSGPLGLVPTGHTADTAAGFTEIYDLSDPAHPVLVKEFQNGYSCHHIYFWNDPAQDKYRAICAGIEMTQIWDTADPLDPKVIVNVPVHHGVADAPSASIFLMAFSHFSILSQDGDTLIVGDEMGGGSVPPGCGVHAGLPMADASTPLGALWFYDVSDETDPKLKGWFSPGEHFTQHDASGSCTAHHGRIVPQEGRDLLAMAFYGAGVVLVDFTDPTMPRMVDQFNDGTDTWEVWYNNGYLFTGDLARGLDVIQFE